MKTIAFVQVASQMSGVEFSTLYLAQHLDRARWSPLVLCPTDGDLPQRCREHHIPVALVPRARMYSTSVRAGEFRIPNLPAWLLNLAAFNASAQNLARFFATQRPDLIVTKGLLAHYYGGLAARRAGIPCVWHIQDRVSERLGAIFPALLALGARAFAQHIIVDAESIARQVALAVPRERIHVIWNGVDVEQFHPGIDGASVRAEWNAAPDDLLIGVIGRLTPWKGQHLLLHAFAQISAQFPRARVVLIGSALFDTDAYARSLREKVEQLGIGARVQFAGFRWDLPRVLAALDVAAHPSLEKDSTPLAVVSAFAAGKAMVCARVDGTAELFDDGIDGLLVPPGDVNALAEKLALLLRDADLRTRLGRAARAKAERRLSIEQHTRACQAVFEKIL